MMSQQARLPIGYTQLASRILACLEDAPKHTLDLLVGLEQTSITLPEPGTLYRVLASLEHQGWIEPLAPEHYLRPYALTPAGEDTLRQFRLSTSIHDERIDARSHNYRRKETYMRLNRTLLRLYPRAWRERYEEEMLAVLEQHTITPATIFDLLLGAIDARFDPHYRSQHSAFSQHDIRLTATAFVALLAVFNAALFIWQTLSVPYVNLLTTEVFAPTGVPLTGAPVGNNQSLVVIGYTTQFQIIPSWDNPGSISNLIAAYSLQIEFFLLLVALLFFVARIVKRAPSARRIPLLLFAFASLLLPLLALPFLIAAPISSLIPDHITLFQQSTLSSSLPSTLMVLEIVGCGLFIGLIRGRQAIREGRKGLFALLMAVVLFPTLGYFISRFFMDNIVIGWLEPSPGFQVVLYNFGASLLPFLGFGALLLAVGTDELPKPVLSRSLRYASALTITLIISLFATVTWNIATWLQLSSEGITTLSAFYINLSPQRVFFGSYGLLLCISLSLFTLLLVGGIGVMLKRGYRALSSPPAQDNEQQPPEMMQARQS